MLQKHGYDLRLSKKPSYKSTDPELETSIGGLKYDNFARKKIKALSVERGLFDYLVTFEEEGAGRKIYADSHKEHIGGIALVADLEKAKERWGGKTIWSKNKTISTYDAENDKHGDVAVRIGDPLKVVDVWWGSPLFGPLWLIVETKDKEKGYIRTKFSWTNQYRDWWKASRPWENDFFESDPKTLGWSDEIWQKINDQRVATGMTKQQVSLSWGEPKSVTSTLSDDGSREQWAYSDQFLYFEGDVLKTIESAK